jgi:hypothetical protein
MGAFSGLTTTTRGFALLGKVQAGTPLVFTRMKVGDGSLSGQSIPSLTDLISVKMIVPLNRLRHQGEGKALIGGAVTNAELSSGFYLREWGIFANDPDLGEILYCYASAGAGADYIPPASSGVFGQQLNAIAIVGPAANVTVEIPSGIYALQSDLDALVKIHYADNAEVKAGDLIFEELT